MNNITYAKIERLDGERTAKHYELIFPDGAGRLTADGKELDYAADCALIIPPLARYAFDAGAAGLRIVIEQAVIPVKEITAVKDDFSGGFRFTASLAEKYSPDGGILPALGGLLAAYAVQLGGNRYSPAVAAIISEIEKNLSDVAFSLEDYMKKMPLNYDYLRKLFRKETGLTPLEYLTGKRMELAREILSGGLNNRYNGYTVSQTAEACGFSEPLYFSRVFKKYYGYAPSECVKKR